VFEETNLCPSRMTDEPAKAWIGLYNHYQAGHLYRAGGLREQPAIYMQIMRFIDGAVKESRRGEADSKIQN
jgi:hypothetical protein